MIFFSAFQAVFFFLWRIVDRSPGRAHPLCLWCTLLLIPGAARRGRWQQGCSFGRGRRALCTQEEVAQTSPCSSAFYFLSKPSPWCKAGLSAAGCRARRDAGVQVLWRTPVRCGCERSPGAGTNAEDCPLSPWSPGGLRVPGWEPAAGGGL